MINESRNNENSYSVLHGISIFKNNYYTMGIALLVIFSMFSFFYVRSVVMPQNGWWHYFAWRVNEGDVLYKDIYMYIPPYFTLFTSFLYKFLKNNFFEYTIYIGYPMKLLCIYLMYDIICRITKPFYAAVSVLVGACLSASYFMDVWYDYNPVLMVPSLLVAKCMQLYFEKGRLFYVLFAGVLIGVLAFSKQTLGIPFLVAVVLMVILGNDSNEMRWKYKSLLYLFCGFIIGLLPGIWYLTSNDCWIEFIKCVVLATGAKGGSNGLISHLKTIMFQKKVWLLTFLIVPFVFYDSALWRTLNKYKSIVKFLSVMGIAYVVYILAGSEFMHIITKPRNSIIILLAIASVVIIYKSEYIKILTELYSDCFHCLYLSFMIFAFIVWGSHSGDYHMYIYNTFHIFGIRRLAISILSYVFTLIWIREMCYFFCNRNSDTKNNVGLLAFLSILFVHFLVGIISADSFEELYMLLYVPWGIAYLFNCYSPKLHLKNFVILASIFLCVMSCLSSKIAIPYDWQGWRTPSIKYNDVSSKIIGLEGCKVSPVVEEQYKKVIRLLKEHTDKTDTVYQFASIPLFNVLSERKIPTFGAISWFDVLPDQIAIADAEALYRKPPKMVIWHNMTEDQWILLEKVFRNGRRSGQRRIKEFYDEIVTTQYYKLYSFYNNRDGDIEIYLRK